VRADANAPGLFAVSRLDPRSAASAASAHRVQHLDALPSTPQVTIDASSGNFLSLVGSCEPSASAPGSYHVEVPPLDYIVCAAGVGP